MKTILFASVFSLLSVQAFAADGYTVTHFVANRDKYEPTIAVEKDMINAWGIATRPVGAGGHFWVTAKDASYEYVGDVAASPNEALRTLHQDKLKKVKLPVGGPDHVATGTVFSDSKDAFVITQEIPGVEPITAPSKFLFASDGGIISAWTERKLADGSFDRSDHAENMIDQSAQGAQFFGLTLNRDYNRLYVADFGVAPGIKVFDGAFKPAAVTFDMPFDENENGVVDPGEYAPFNIQALNGHIFVTYAKTQACPDADVKKDTCKAGALFAGEEDTSKPGQGRLAEFTEDGALVAVWKDGGHLSAPWGVAFAPDHFGALSGKLLVGNFGDGKINAYDPKTHEFAGTLNGPNGEPVVVDKVWGLVFGNGESLGDADALYFAAGPEDETDGVFGVIRQAQ